MPKLKNLIYFLLITTVSLCAIFSLPRNIANAPITHWYNPYSRKQPLYYFWNYCYADHYYENGHKTAKKHCDCEANHAESLSLDQQIALTFFFERLSPYYSSDYRRLEENGTLEQRKNLFNAIDCN